MDNSGNKFSIAFGNKTDVGKQREKNEDYLESFKSSFGDVFIVCDGMGGHLGGEVASRLAIATAKNFILSNNQNITGTKEIIRAAIKEANEIIFRRSKEEANLKGMGTTIVVVIVNNGIVYYGHVGDSRLYIIRGRKIYQLTHDHSFVQTLVDQGLITETEAENHPRKNEITRALGIGEAVVPDIPEKGLMLYKNDKLVLCSDGLTNMVSDRDIFEVVNEIPPMDAAEKLISMANMAGGNDNITLQVINVTGGPELPEDLNNIPPEGAVVKAQRPNVDRAVTMELGGFDAPQPHTPKQKKRLIFVISSLALLVILLTGFYLIDPINLFNKKESIKTVNNSENAKVNLKENIRELLSKVYSDQEYEQSKIVDTVFKYRGSKSHTDDDYTLDSLRANAKKSHLKFVSISDDNGENNFKYEVQNDKEKISYEIMVTENNGKIRIQSIRAIRATDRTSRNPESNDTKAAEDIKSGRPGEKQQTPGVKQKKEASDNNSQEKKQNANQEEKKTEQSQKNENAKMKSNK